MKELAKILREFVSRQQAALPARIAALEVKAAIAEEQRDGECYEKRSGQRQG